MREDHWREGGRRGVMEWGEEKGGKGGGERQKGIGFDWRREGNS